MKAKKFLVIGLVLVLSICLVGCNEKDTQNDNQNIVSGDNNVSSGENNNSGNTNDLDMVGTDNEITATVNDIMTEIAEKANLNVRMPMQIEIPVEISETAVGLTSEVFTEFIEDSVILEAQISPSNQSYCLVKVKNFDDVKMIRDTIFENANPAKWVCMGADRVLVTNAGRYVLLAMGPKDSCDSLLEAFNNYFGGNTGVFVDRYTEFYDPNAPVENFDEDFGEDFSEDFSGNLNETPEE